MSWRAHSLRLLLRLERQWEARRAIGVVRLPGKFLAPILSEHFSEPQGRPPPQRLELTDGPPLGEAPTVTRTIAAVREFWGPYAALPAFGVTAGFPWTGEDR